MIELKLRVVNDEVLYSADPVTRVASRDIETLVARALATPRKRARLCTHKDEQDPLHEMLIVHTQETYVRPHLHKNKPESLYIMKGEAALILFSEDGSIRQWTEMGEYASGKPFYCRIADPVYHMLLIRSPVMVFHEVTQGPFRPQDTKFAPWSPDGSTPGEVARFLERIQLGQQKSNQGGFDR
ncbi:WbuC family cupin fold metalloprotein [Citrifermentans bremense]|uniref:WbuC family cupin fold metalloprotein n=1 Tax=Citrifermentans bremense TaxID=60035 RepID=UPI0003F73654|nr:WbuC family cupin fold metalloprotein [Citrifermentans bremense]